MDADNGGYSLAVIQANETPIGFSIFSGNRTYGFGFKKREDLWRAMEFKDTDPFRLHAGFVKNLVSRIDLAFNHNNISALVLFLSNDWTLTGRVEEGRGSLGRAATPRFPSPLIKPDVRISRSHGLPRY